MHPPGYRRGGYEKLVESHRFRGGVPGDAGVGLGRHEEF